MNKCEGNDCKECVKILKLNSYEKIIENMLKDKKYPRVQAIDEILNEIEKLK